DDPPRVRPPARHAVLHDAGPPGALPAPVLVLRPSRGLRDDPARVRLDLRDRPGLCAQADLRLHVDGGGTVRHRLPVDDGVGAPHVHGCMNTYVEGLFMVMTMPIPVPTGIQVFNWIGTALWGS